MINKTDENKKVTVKFGLNCGMLYMGLTSKGCKFCSKLIDVVEDVLVFENSTGDRYFHHTDEIKYLEPYRTLHSPDHHQNE